MGEQNTSSVQNSIINSSEKTPLEAIHLEQIMTQDGNLVYDGDEEPEVHMRTWIALAAMFLLNLVQVFALQGPPAVASKLMLVKDLSLITFSCPILEPASTTLKPRRGCRTHFHSSKQSSAP